MSNRRLLVVCLLVLWTEELLHRSQLVMSLASDDSVVDKIVSLLASATESSEGTREGRSFPKNA